MKNYFIYLLTALLISCTSNKFESGFQKNVTGRYLYNSNEIIEVYFENDILYLNWRGANKIKPLKVSENTFYIKEMNEKIRFLINPINREFYMSLVPKDNKNELTYNFKKLKDSEKIPDDYLKSGDFDNALKLFVSIKQKDSLDANINENYLNKAGYNYLRNKEFVKAINIFKINVALYPYSSNVYDSLGEAYLKSGDTLLAVTNYKKSLALDSANKRAKKIIEKYSQKN